MFRSLPIIYDVRRPESLDAEVRQYRLETITLGWEERVQARRRRRSDQGTYFATALTRGTVLRAHDCLVLDAAGLVVKVVESEEPVLIVEPKTPQEWALFAYCIGNTHQPIMITERTIVCADVPGMDQVLDQHRIPFRRAARSFTPIGVGNDAYASDHVHVSRF